MTIRHFAFLFVIILGFTQAHSGGEVSGGGIIKSKFSSMTAEEAFNSNQFAKMVERKTIPRSSTSYNPSSELCIEQNYVRSLRVRPSCVEWYVQDSSIGGRIIGFENLNVATEFAREHGIGEPYCVPENSYGVVFAAPTDSMKTDYKIDFYDKDPKRFSDAEFLGKHKYTINPCNRALMGQPAIEWSIAE